MKKSPTSKKKHHDEPAAVAHEPTAEQESVEQAALPPVESLVTPEPVKQKHGAAIEQAPPPRMFTDEESVQIATHGCLLKKD